MSDLKKQLEIIKQGIEEIIGEDDLVQESLKIIKY